MDLQTADLPTWLQAQVPANQRIAFFELLAQAALCFLRMRENPGSSSTVAFAHRCDNAASVGAVQRYFTVKEPLCFALQALSYHAACFHCEVTVSHVPGVQNTLADHISRHRFHAQTIALLNPDLEVVDFTLRDILGPVWDMHS